MRQHGASRLIYKTNIYVSLQKRRDSKEKKKKEEKR